jgi:hypothetical protein
MLPRQPLRLDDPGSGKTIMAGLLMKELIARGDLHRSLSACSGTDQIFAAQIKSSRSRSF